MCANVADKRPLRMNTLANGKCVSSAYTQPATHVYTHTPTQMDTPTVVHTKCLFAWIHMQMCMSLCVCVCVMLEHFMDMIWHYNQDRFQ